MLSGAFGFLLILMLLGLAMMQMTLVAAAGNVLRQTVYTLAAIFTLVALRPFARPKVILAIPWPVMLALGYCLFSLTWAIDPDVGARRLFLTVLVTWTVFAAVHNLGYDRALTVLRVVMGSAVFLNIAVAVLLPQYGVHQASTDGSPMDENLIGDWCGFIGEKNRTAAATAFTAILFLYGGGRMPWGVRPFVLLATFFLLYKTGSRTSLGLCIAVLGISAFYLFYRARYRFTLLVAMIVGFTAVGNIIGFLKLDRLFTANNTRELLSGRTDIWEALVSYAKDTGYAGAGYGSFWDIGAFSPIYSYGNTWVIKLSQGHNGYLDLLVTIGAVGLVVAIATTLVWPLVQLLSTRSAEGPRGAMVLAMIVFAAGHNGTETSLLDRDTLTYVMHMVALALLTLVLSDRQSGPKGGKPLQWLGMDPAEQLIVTSRDPRIDENRGGWFSSPRRRRRRAGAAF